MLELTLGAWVVLELGVRVRELAGGRGRTGHDRFTRILIAAAIGVSVAAAVGRAHAQSTEVPLVFRAGGLVVIWLGLATRIWAIAALGEAFRTTVEVTPGQRVVVTGPYARIRHPSYAGLFLILAGLGVTTGDWRAMVVCVVVPTLALLVRIRVEEAELVRVLGDAYRRYQGETKRLVPGVW